MNIVFLDPQLLANIRSHISMRTTNGVEIAKSVDHGEYVVSSLLASFGKHLANVDSALDHSSKDSEETKLLKKFYKKAQNECEIITNAEPNMLVSFINLVQPRLNRSLPFILYLHQCLNKIDEQTDKEVLRDEIFAQAQQFHVENANPLIIVAMAALYEHPLAQNLFTKENSANKNGTSYLTNTQLNLINIYLLPYLVSMYSKQIWSTSEATQTINYTLLTPQESFNELMASLEISGQPEQNEAQIECAFDINITVDLFPQIAHDEIKLNELVSLFMAPPQEPITANIDTTAA